MMQFRFFKKQPVLHAFSTRLRGYRSFPSLVDLSARLAALGFDAHSFVEAEQVHGNDVAVVTRRDLGRRIPQVDALVTNEPGVSLVVRTADCSPIFLFNPLARCIGLVHSGKKGTALDIVTATIAVMKTQFGCQAEHVMALLGPCIRPPHYEIDFAAEIRSQLMRAGVTRISDCGINTASNLHTFYSYRIEKGKTGRHYSILALRHDR